MTPDELASIKERAAEHNPHPSRAIDDRVVLIAAVEQLTAHADDRLTVYGVTVTQPDEEPAQRYRWRRQAAGNNEILCQGEAYVRLEGAIAGALRANPDLTRDQVQVAE